MTNRKPWDDAENPALVSLYFDMLDAEQAGCRYSKADMIRAQRGEPQTSCYAPNPAPLANRSRGSIEFKLMNASAAHADIDPEAETMHSHGYRALPNYQATLREAMAHEIECRAHTDALDAKYDGRPEAAG